MKFYEVEKYKLFIILINFFIPSKLLLFLLDDEHNHQKIYIIKIENFIKSSLNTFKIFNPFLIFETDIPTVKATAAAATEFLTL